jgi:GDP-L-fucose synthase
MPTNLYGPGDNFDLQSSHVVPALIAKAHAVKTGTVEELVVWGTGSPLREFMYIDDLADALVFLMRHYNAEEHINVGVAEEVSIRQLAVEVANTVGVQAALRFDATKPDGTPRKLMDSSRLLAMGWRPKTSLAEGLRRTYEWYQDKYG